MRTRAEGCGSFVPEKIVLRDLDRIHDLTVERPPQALAVVAQVETVPVIPGLIVQAGSRDATTSQA